MTRRRRAGRSRARRRLPLPAAALALAAQLPAGASADEAIARRLAALHALVRPAATRAALRSVPAASRCPHAHWWRASEYALRARTDAAIRDASIRFAVPARLIRSVIRHESAYRVDAVSSARAMGLMQLIPATAEDLGVVCPFDPRENVLAGTRYLRRMRDRFGRWDLALSAYHAGPERVARGRIPAVTERYVRRVLSTWRNRGS